MTVKNVIEGLQILSKYQDNEHFISADYDCIYVYAADKDISREDLEKLDDMGWHQHDYEWHLEVDDGEWTPDKFHPEAGWRAFV